MEDKQTPRTLVRTAIKNITQRSETPLLDRQDAKERYETPAPRPSDVTKELSMLAGQPLVCVFVIAKIIFSNRTSIIPYRKEARIPRKHTKHQER